ncbi:Uncharacterised protein [Bacteroides thetaiotaomicron]|uniref:Uncharacterized protein n=1 Tax=Bacteroides thetaiotaomicron TaxID=818 RepID=A0A174QSB3_BACT4|nr:Uncharacterised protein [Bacteroides thetaiotaomicron]
MRDKFVSETRAVIFAYPVMKLLKADPMAFKS